MRTILMLLAAAAAFTAAAGRADPVADFYRGRTVEIVVGSDAGGGYDLVARTLGAFIGRHIPGSPDVVALRVTVTGKRRGAPAEVSWELIDQYDAERGISAMMRTTGFSLAITGWMQVKGLVAGAGVKTPDEAVPAEPYVAELATRGVMLKQSAR